MYFYVFPLSVYVFLNVDIEGSHQVLVLACLCFLFLATTESSHFKGLLYVIASTITV